MSVKVEAAMRSWLAPVVAVVAGVGYLVAAAVGGHAWFGVTLLLIMVLFAATAVVLARRSETIAGILYHRDERISAIDVRATAAAGGVVTVAIVAAGMVELARDRSGAPYAWLATIEAVAYVVALVVGRARG